MWTPAPQPHTKRGDAGFAKLDVLPDFTDFRDRAYEPALVEVPPEITLQSYRAFGIPLLDQGSEGACTGFALATVAHYLLRARKISPDTTQVSARMFYEMAKRYDQFPGEAYDGSTARGAIKGWYKHGVCPEALWPDSDDPSDTTLTIDRARAAKKYPLGAYYRVDSKDVVAMHAALSEVGVLYVTCAVHEGWRDVQADGQIVQSDQIIGGHAFAIVAFDSDGFWLQNSWGDSWGAGGFGHITYDDWLANGSDVWVVRLGAEIHSQAAINYDSMSSTGLKAASNPYCDLRPHVVTIGKNGQLGSIGPFANDEAAIGNIFSADFARITSGWSRKRICFYAHGGLVSEPEAIARVNEWRAQLLKNEIYPVFFLWHTDLISTMTSMLENVLSLPNLSSTTQKVNSIIDHTIDPFARTLGMPIWSDMKAKAMAATGTASGGARVVAQQVATLCGKEPVELHFVAHSAGSILLSLFMYYLCAKGVIPDGPLAGRIGLGLSAKTLTLWAPACTMDLFKSTFGRLLADGGIDKFALYTLDDATERADNCLHIYHESLLYLVANALEETPRNRWSDQPGTPLLGLQVAVQADESVRMLFNSTGSQCTWVVCPSAVAGSLARSHGQFDHEPVTLQSTMNRILAAD